MVTPHRSEVAPPGTIDLIYTERTPGAITLGRMGVHQKEQGKTYGAILLVDAIKRCCLVSQEVGVYAIIVDAKNDNARAFYEHYGFSRLPQNSLRLILPMGTAVQLLA